MQAPVVSAVGGSVEEACSLGKILLRMRGGLSLI